MSQLHWYFAAFLALASATPDSYIAHSELQKPQLPTLVTPPHDVRSKISRGDMLREVIDLQRGVNGDGELRRQVSLDEVTDDLEDRIMPTAISSKFHSHRAIVEDVGESLF